MALSISNCEEIVMPPHPRALTRLAIVATFALLALTSLPHNALAQSLGVPSQVSLPSGSGTLTLDFTNNDYQLILYSGLRDESDSTHTYLYTVTGAFSSKPTVTLPTSSGPATTSPKEALRREEAELAKRFLQTGKPDFARKAASFQIGSTRSFAFDEFGDVSAQTVTATLVATSSRAEAWVDNNTSAITTAQVQAQIDQFSTSTYPIVTSVFGDPSDVDGDGKVLFLYTELVDQVGGVAGFYRSKSLFSTSDGGDGNQADMMYIGLDHGDSFFESLLAHEFQHLISYNQHVLVHDGPSEISPINEAMSHVAEDLVDQHTQGGNPDNVRTYTETPASYSILAESAHDSGVRGTAYTFARSMMESFGDNVPTQLVQTSQSGIENVETVSGQTFEEVYETYLARMFLAGSGLNSSYEFSYPFFSDPVTGGRSIPVPDEHALNPNALSVSGLTKAYAASSIRLMGTGVSTINIDTDVSGDFRGVLIPIPSDFQHNIALKSDYFAGYDFDSVLTGQFTTGTTTKFSGTTTVSDVSEILLRFVPLDAAGDTISFKSTVANSAFAVSTLFSHDKAGAYEMSIFAGQTGASLPFVGRIPVVHVTEGSGSFDLPTDYFSGIQLEAVIPTEIAAGDAVRLSGTMTDPSVTEISFEFLNTVSGTEVDAFFDVVSGSFEGVVVFGADQVGSYKLECYAGQAGQSLPSVGRFLGFTVTESAGAISLPVDFFEGVTLTTGLPTEFKSGQTINLTGTITDSSIEVVLFRYTSDTGEEVRFQLTADGTSFRKGAVFFPSQVGTYTLDVFGGAAGQSLAHRGTFSPITVSTGQGPIFLPVDIFAGLVLDEPLKAEFFSGETRRLAGTLTDQSATEIAIRLDGVDGSTGDSEFASVSAGRFDVAIPFSGLSAADYDIVLFAGTAGQSLPFLDSVGPVSIVSSQSRFLFDSAALTFPETQSGQTTIRTFNFTNVGSAPLSFTGSNLSSGIFSAGDLPASTAAGATGTISIAFAPTSGGAFSGTWTLSTNDPSQPSVTFALSGTGIAVQTPLMPVPVFDKSSLSFAETQTGSTSTLSLILTNVGDTTLAIDSLVVVGPFIFSSPPATVPSSTTFAIDVTFSPVASGATTGTLTLYSNADGDPIQVTLSGSANPPSLGDPTTEILTDAYPGITLGAPISLAPTVGNEIALTGTIQDGSIGILLFQFLPVLSGTSDTDPDRTEKVIVATITAEDTFSEVIAFVEGEEGAYELHVLGGNPNAITIPTLGSSTGIVVSAAVTEPPVTTLLGDIDGNGSVNFTDFLSFAGAFGTSATDSAYLAAADLDSNGSINFSDFLTFASQFGKSL
jgi:hypothetical protein